MGHAREASGLMRGYDDKAYDYDGSTMGTKRNVTGNGMSRYDEGMLNGEGQFANMPQNVVMKAWPKSPTGEMAEYPNGLMSADAQMRRDKKGIHKVGLPNKG